MYFVGIDLAWSTKNGSGISILKGDENKAELIKYDIKYSDSEILDFINKEVGENDALIAIDAPLIVPNESGRRIAEEEVGKLFRKFNAGAHPANRQRLSSWTGTIRGEEISKVLEKEGFLHNPYIKKGEKTRTFFEVYPHPSTVVLFNLDKILKYKAKPKRDYNFRYIEFEKYLKHLKNLEKSETKLLLPKEIAETKLRELKAQKLKDFEDTLDSVFCAYIAYYCWKNPDNCAVLGNMKGGYILTPIFDYMKDNIKELTSQRKLVDFSKN